MVFDLRIRVIVTGEEFLIRFKGSKYRGSLILCPLRKNGLKISHANTRQGPEFTVDLRGQGTRLQSSRLHITFYIKYRHDHLFNGISVGAVRELGYEALF